jgi:hypothetical protein
VWTPYYRTVTIQPLQEACLCVSCVDTPFTVRIELNMTEMRFWDRVKLAWRILIDAEYATNLTAEPPPEKAQASGLMLLSALQRDGRFIDFLQQEVTGFSDEDIGAAARVVHGGCRKAIRQYFDFAPATDGAEGAAFTVPAGFDAQRIRLTGNVTGNAPFKGVLKHHGWVAANVRMPAVSDSIDPKVIAPAEVELS